jgi:hypothetical protein
MLMISAIQFFLGHVHLKHMSLSNICFRMMVHVRHTHSIIKFSSLMKTQNSKHTCPLQKKKVSWENGIRIHSFHAPFHLIHDHTLGMKLPEGVVALKSLEDSRAHCFSVQEKKGLGCLIGDSLHFTTPATGVLWSTLAILPIAGRLSTGDSTMGFDSGTLHVANSLIIKLRYYFYTGGIFCFTNINQPSALKIKQN